MLGSNVNSNSSKVYQNSISELLEIARILLFFALSKHTRSNQVEVFCKKDVKYFAKLTWKDSFFIKSEGAYFFKKKKNLFHRTLTVASSKTSIVPPKSGKQVIHLIFEFKSLIWEWIFESIFCTNRFL